MTNNMDWWDGDDDVTILDHEGSAHEGGFGVGLMRVRTPKTRGTLQQYCCQGDFEFLDIMGQEADVGKDYRVYKTKEGLITCSAPVQPVGEGQVYVHGWDRSALPPESELASLFDQFFSKYDREVLVLVGKIRLRGLPALQSWLYLVPKQVGTPGQVTWEADDEIMGEFLRDASWVGTIHVHPGIGCTPSQTDIDDWANPEKSGLHVIFGRDGSYTVNGAIAERTFQLDEGSVVGVTRSPITLTTSNNQPLTKLLTVPAPCIVQGTRFNPGGASRQALLARQEVPNRYGGGTAVDYIDTMLYRVGAVQVDNGVSKLRVVVVNNKQYVMTTAQYVQLRTLCGSVCMVPGWRKIGRKDISYG